MLLLVACSGDAADATGAGDSEGETTADTSTGDESTGDDATSTTTSGGTSTSGSGSTGEPTTASTTAEPTTASTTAEPTTSSTTDDSTSTTTDDSTTGEPACDGSGLTPGDHTVMVTHDGTMRSAIVHVPPSYDPTSPTPLVLNFHGFTSNAAQQVLFSGMNPLADDEGFLVAYPDGLDSSWNAGACCGTSMQQNIDDVGFVRDLVDALEAQLCVDARRIYATGMSNGGFMSNRLACEAADLFAAVAPVSSVNGMKTCEPSRPIPVMLFNGTADPLVFYNGGLYISAPETFAEWGDRDLCVGAPIETKKVGAATCETYESCADGVEVTFCTLEGMGHCWPGNPICPLGQPSTDLDANAEMWAFFSMFTLP
ncbi:MAG: PHB depolymerase family esterase [Nannocystaceae bacterium]